MTQAIEATIKAQARERVTKVLNGLWNTMGPLNREELGALLDGAQEATSEWMPPAKPVSAAAEARARVAAKIAEADRLYEERHGSHAS